MGPIPPGIGIPGLERIATTLLDFVLTSSHNRLLSYQAHPETGDWEAVEGLEKQAPLLLLAANESLLVAQHYKGVCFLQSPRK